MRQIYQQNLFTDGNLSNTSGDSNETLKDHGAEHSDPAAVSEADGRDATTEGTVEINDESANRIASASMWTRKDIKEFKESVRAEGGEAIIRINQGESVTVCTFNVCFILKLN